MSRTRQIGLAALLAALLAGAGGAPARAQTPGARVSGAGPQAAPSAAQQAAALQAAALQFRRAASVPTPSGLEPSLQRLSSSHTQWLLESARAAQILGDRWALALKPPEVRVSGVAAGRWVGATDDSRRLQAVNGGFALQLAELRRRLEAEHRRYAPLGAAARLKYEAGAAALGSVP